MLAYEARHCRTPAEYAKIDARRVSASTWTVGLAALVIAGLCIAVAMGLGSVIAAALGLVHIGLAFVAFRGGRLLWRLDPAGANPAAHAATGMAMVASGIVIWFAIALFRNGTGDEGPAAGVACFIGFWVLALVRHVIAVGKARHSLRRLHEMQLGGG